MKISIFSRISRLSIFRILGIWVDYLVNYHWNNFPLGKIINSKSKYLELWKSEKNINYPEIDQYEEDFGFSLDKFWLDNLALHTQVVIKSSPLCWQHGRVLFTTLSYWLQNNSVKDSPIITIWETGTARGFSSLCMSKALESQGRHAKIVTFDVLPHNSKMYWNCIDDHDGPKTRSELIEPWSELSSKYIFFIQGDSKISLKKTFSERIHFAFLDGSHTYDDVMFEFNQIKEYQKAGDIIVFDDYNKSQFPGLVKAVDEICKNSNYLRRNLFAKNSRAYVIATKE
jgi:hypothetical protein